MNMYTSHDLLCLVQRQIISSSRFYSYTIFRKNLWYILNLIFNKLANNYEVSEWEVFYLKIWEENTFKNDISCTSLLFRLGVVDIPILQDYFKPFGGRVSITTFIEFICTFVFFTTEQILPLLLTISNVRSNRLITSVYISYVLYYVLGTNV